MRKPRIKRQGAVYHVYARMNRQEMVLENAKFKSMFLNVVKIAKKKYDFLFRNFSIMGNHVHLDIEPLDNTDLSRLMQWILSVFAIRYNKLHGYKGHVWYDRFKSAIKNSVNDYINSYFYIANNPVRAGIVNHPLDFDFNGITFYKKNLGQDFLDPPHEWMKPLIEEFLENYDANQYRTTQQEYSFRDKRPGRPKKLELRN